MHYTHLSLEERYRIAAMIETGSSLTEIARALDRSPSTILRERASRPVGKNGRYCAATAHQHYVESKAPNARTIDESVWLTTLGLLDFDWSPEQIAGRLKKEAGGKSVISHESVYKRLATDKRNGGKLYKRLRHPRPYRHRNTKETRGKIPNRQDISTRPAAVETRQELGHWELDTVIGGQHRGAIVTLNERMTGLSLQVAVKRKCADLVAAAITSILGPIKQWVKTITADNGLEFAGHESITTAIGATVYFAKPHSPWQRGSNENTNGLIRQYFPKKTPLDKLLECDIHDSMFRLNNRPRKRLGYKTPLELFAKLTGCDYTNLVGFMMRS